ncbi:5'-3' exonuclease [Rhodococcus sp. BP-349]|uniref:5'-3' exonuclease n=1 Tax=unclassified Rhodococcus (in: high G+C Gram-positive bacteria) TaxID=192944 RepID=UPI001C9B05E6|nr:MULTISPECIES: 5'-3' exonuclease [unclassified Rhodococcus (in: high G+C Gram-positive bacteria)]MBY6541269.1 5'-3' exonuclease [Rhodococcus sp. BP-363]MBY6544705.1 5'-3' exonuclease [Rhodococcus sp. BP-369]MBY6563935.1 5'-3' exonuclease [Rhodococcus sp. BP-370]MBY6579128.1 5'-3' exonuclease [Rhodococcus sp. BP-364]MBY6588429.1 5'-3' exonuclease [Rhodococcus sp. BP-358]
MWRMTAESRDTVLLLDAASLWFRAFHALPESMTAPDGRPVNAVRGFTDMVASLITRTGASRLAVCLDLDWRPTFRVDLVPSYKAHRVLTESAAGPDAEEAPDALGPQVNLILEILEAAGIATAGAEGLEADDVLGTLAATERDGTVVVVSGDRDLLQVVSDDPVPVRVLYAGRGLAKAELFGPAEVAAKYGVPADRPGPGYAELALLRGDSSDGLPGVKGVGEKTAASLMQKFGSLEALLDAADSGDPEMSAGVRAKIQSSRDYIDAALPVVRVVTDADIIFSRPDVLPHEPVDPERLAALAEELGVQNSVGRLLTAMAR